MGWLYLLGKTARRQVLISTITLGGLYIKRRLVILNGNIASIVGPHSYKSLPSLALRMTKVIIRVDDVTPSLLNRLENWFLQEHPDVPISCFAIETQNWGQKAWETSSSLVANYNWEFGGHTRSHIKLPNCDYTTMENEITKNLKDIEDGISSEMDTTYDVQSFSYPFGLYGAEAVDILKENGIKNGLTYSEGLPYCSSIQIPSGEERYRWGITNDGSGHIDFWNYKFNYANDNGEAYILSLHPSRWKSILLNIVHKRQTGMSAPTTIIDTAINSITDSYQGKWEMLNEHINHIKNHDNVEFATPRQITK